VMSITWVDDDAAKVVLAEIGIATRDETIDVDCIDRKASSENRARDVHIDESRIDGIVNAANKGVPIPKIVVRKRGHKMVICGGNHRFAGVDCMGEKLIPVHVIECTDAEFEIACRVLNTVVGNGMTRQERICNAIDAVERLGMSHKSACSVYGISELVLNSSIKTLAAQRRLEFLAPKVRSKVSVTHLKTLGDLAKNDNVLRAAASAVAEKEMKVRDLQELCSIARLQPTESMQVAVFERELARQDVSKSIVPKKIRAKFISALNTLEQLKDKKTWESMEVKQSEVATFKSQIRNVKDMLDCLCKANG